MKPIHTLEDIHQVKALADPLRQRLLEEFFREAMTTKQVADRLDEKPTRLYHHVNILEEAGLIQLVGTRQNRGTVEKYYRSVARQFAVSHALLSMGPDSGEAAGELHGMIVRALEEGAAEARALFDSEAYADPAEIRPAIAGSPRIRTTPEEAAVLAKRLQELLDAFQDAHTEDGSVEYRLTLAFYPTRSTKKTT